MGNSAITPCLQSASERRPRRYSVREKRRGRGGIHPKEQKKNRSWCDFYPNKIKRKKEKKMEGNITRPSSQLFFPSSFSSFLQGPSFTTTPLLPSKPLPYFIVQVPISFLPADLALTGRQFFSYWRPIKIQKAFLILLSPPPFLLYFKTAEDLYHISPTQWHVTNRINN